MKTKERNLRILELLKEKGITEKEMVEYLGLGNGAFTHWKYDNLPDAYSSFICKRIGRRKNTIETI